METRKMKTLKGWLTGGILTAVMIFGTTMAKADPGIIFGNTGDGNGGGQTCQNGNGGIIFGDAGIIFGSTGIIFGGIIFGSTDDNGCTSDSGNSGLLISD
jgi:hypothetical protein